MARSRAGNKGGLRVATHMHPALFKACLTLPPEPREPMKEKGRQGKRIIPDEVIKAMKTMFHVDGKNLTEVRQAFPDLKPKYIYDVLVNESIRRNIRP